MGLTEAKSLVALLITPAETPSSPLSDKNWFQSILESKIQEYCTKCGLTLGTESDKHFDYVRCCVNALVNLKFELTNISDKKDIEENSKGTALAADTLSISQLKNVASLVQMILALGVLPNLLPGVGTPLGKRSAFLQTVITGVPKRSILERYKQLVFSLESLLELARYRQFHATIVTKQLGDLIACLVQVSQAPLVKPTDGEQENVADITVKEDNFVMTPDLYERLVQDQERFKAELATIVEKSYQPLLVKDLVILLSCSADSNAPEKMKPPKWFSRAVAAMLSARLVVAGGVLAAVRGVLDLGGEESQDWTQVNMLANVLGNPPQGRYADTEQYYAAVGPQLLELLVSEESQLSMIACCTIKIATERSLILSRRHLLDPLLEVFMKLTRDYKEALSVTEKELDEGLKNLCKVFVLGNDPSLMFVTHLEPVILVLLNLHSSITFGVSHLKDPVKQLVERYLKFSDNTTSLRILRAFALEDTPQTTQNRARLLHKDVMLANGDEGGVKVMKKSDSEQSFYLTDDEKSIVIQDLLEELKDKMLSSQFFLSLMEDLSNVMLEDEKDGFDIEFPEAVVGGDIEKQLHDLEDHLDNTMHRMRRNLMIIRLLSLLSEDGSFQENLAKDSGKMVRFISSSVSRAAQAVRQEKECSTIANQSLNMALSILTVHLTRAELTTEDWETMLEIEEDLETLSHHQDERIAEIAGKLSQLVAVQGVVIKEVKNLKDKTAQIKEGTVKVRQKLEEIKNVRHNEENKSMDDKKAQLKQKAEELKLQKEKRKKKTKDCKTPYDEALFNIGDPLIPVQGHGLIQLTRLVEEKDEETMENIDKVRLLFMSNLEDEDSYIYLSSITGLVACARYRTDLVIECLTKEFSAVQDRKLDSEQSEDAAMAIRTKVGEALVKITKELGDITPKYKNLLLNSFFAAGNDPDPLVRASSLSNLGKIKCAVVYGDCISLISGEVCKNLRFSLGGIAGELLEHLAASARDRAADVRGAAVMVLVLTLQGLGPDTFTVLQGTLREVYRELRLLAGTEKDEAVLGQISLALQEIDNIVRQFLTPDTSLTKKIVVLDLNSQ